VKQLAVPGTTFQTKAAAECNGDDRVYPGMYKSFSSGVLMMVNGKILKLLCFGLALT
jgi:hypothetical protein